MTTAKVLFQSAGTDPFSQTLKGRVDEYFQSRGLSKHANAFMVFKTVFYIGSYLTLYGLILSNQFSSLAMLGLAVLLGCFAAGIGFNVSHDAAHGAYSSRPWLNNFVASSFKLMGADPENWRVLHNVIHHSYTNIPEADGDLHPVPFLRFYAHEGKRRPCHRFQHFYAFFLYTLTTFVWVFQKDFVHIRKRRHLIYEKPTRPTRSDYAQLVVSKSLYYFAFLVLPMMRLSVPWWQVLVGFFAMHAAAGLCLALVFQLGHLVEGTSFPHLTDSPMKDSWFAHQVRTSSNFSTRNPLACFLTGGLNFQVEHHLFPRICHVHYPAISKIVKQTALEYGLPYHEQKSFGSALRSHRRLLKRMGSLEAM